METICSLTFQRDGIFSRKPVFRVFRTFFLGPFFLFFPNVLVFTKKSHVFTWVPTPKTRICFIWKQTGFFGNLTFFSRSLWTIFDFKKSKITFFQFFQKMTLFQKWLIFFMGSIQNRGFRPTLKNLMHRIQWIMEKKGSKKGSKTGFLTHFWLRDLWFWVKKRSKTPISVVFDPF